MLDKVFGVIIILLILLGVYSYKTQNYYHIYGGNSSFSKFYHLPKQQEILKNVLSNKSSNVIELKDIDKSFKYQPNVKSKSVLHIGQLKLMLSELEFLTYCLDDHKKQILFVYAGSAPCNHLPFIAEYFPNIKFLLIDPNENVLMFEKNKTHYDSEYMDQVLYFKSSIKDSNSKNKKINMYNFKTNKIDVILRSKKTDEPLLNKILDVINKTDKRYFIYEDLFTDELSEYLGKCPDLYFCSDIRTNSGETNFKNYPSDLDVLFNSAQQYNWLNNMKPIYSMLKFRCPYMDMIITDIDSDTKKSLDKIKDKIDFIEDYKLKKFKYFEGDKVYIQSFPGVSSNETRLIVSKNNIINNKLIYYDHNEYDDKLFYYNKFIRPFCYHDNKDYFDENLGIDACGDCNIMIFIFKQYYDKYKIKYTPKIIKDRIKKILDIIDKTLIIKASKHGKFFNPYDIQYLFHNKYF